jgi:hypothetical protein
MADEIGVLIVHGMGTPAPSYAEGLVERLTAALGPAAARVRFEACHWSPILQPAQDRVWARLRAGGARMDQQWARRWLVSALGDPAGYLSGYLQDGEPVYARVHEAVRAALARLAGRLARADATPLVVLAHSLGSVIVSNYVWNEQRASGEVRPAASPGGDAPPAARRAAVGRTPFERMETLTTLVTYGSNIPLFVPPVERLECIRLPRATLPARYRAVARWLNVYDPDDLLGYPLATLWDDTKGTRITDVTVDAGPFLASGTPFAHTFYNSDRDFVALVARELATVLSA